MSRARFLGVAVLLAACGARTTNTALLVTVESELRTPMIDKVVIEARSAGDGSEHVFPIDDNTLFPLSLAIVPRGTPDFEVDVTAVASKNGNPIVTQTARVRFKSSEQTTVPLALSADCAGHTCGGEQSCVQGRRCVPVTEVVTPAPADGGAAAASDGAIERPGPDRPGDRSAPPGQWMQVPSAAVPPLATLNAVWPVATNDVWITGQAAGRGVVYHYDGQAVTPAMVPVGAPPLTGIWASGPTEVWLVGYSGTVLRKMGADFRMVPPPTTEVLTGVWGFGPNDVWVVGRGATVQRWNGSAWTAAMGVTGDLLAVTGVGSGELWAVGTAGGIFLYTAARGWERQAAGMTLNPLYAVWAASATDVWAVGEQVALHFDGRAWTRVATPLESTLGIWGSGPDDIWAVGGMSAGGSPIAHFDGSSWLSVRGPVTTTVQRVRGISAADVWAVGNAGVILRYRR